MRYIANVKSSPGFFALEIWQEDEFSNEYFLWDNDGSGDPTFKDTLFTTRYKSLDELYDEEELEAQE